MSYRRKKPPRCDCPYLDGGHGMHCRVFQPRTVPAEAFRPLCEAAEVEFDDVCAICSDVGSVTFTVYETDALGRRFLSASEDGALVYQVTVKVVQE